MAQVTVQGTVYHITIGAVAPHPGTNQVTGMRLVGLSGAIAEALVNSGQTATIAQLAGGMVVGSPQDGIATIKGWIVSGPLTVWS